MRELTRPDLRLTKRGSGRPLGPTPESSAFCSAGAANPPHAGKARERSARPANVAPTVGRRDENRNTFVPLRISAPRRHPAGRPFSLSSATVLVTQAAGRGLFPLSPVLVKEV